MRASFLTGGEPSDLVRPEVVESWRRCARGGLAPDRLELAYSPDVDLDSELCRAARPVVDRLAERLDTSHTALILADEQAGIVARWAGQGTVLSALDGVDALPGVHLDEGRAGTNGLGTPLELGKPVVISGPEHFADRYQGFTCAGVPIRHPVDDRPLGVLDLVCRYGDANGLMLPILSVTVEEIHRRLLQGVPTFERVLLERFLTERARRTGPVVVLGGDVVLANAAAQALSAADHDLLRGLAEDATGSRLDTEVTLATGAVARVQAEPLTDVPGRVGYLVELTVVPATPATASPTSAGASSTTSSTAARSKRAAGEGGGTAGDRATVDAPTDELDGRGWSRAWQRALADARRHATFDLPVLAVGEVGTGKLTLLHAMWRHSGRPGPVRVADLALLAVEGAGPLLERVRAWSSEGNGLVVLRHVEVLDGPQALALAAVLDEAPDGAAHLAATACVPGGQAGVELPVALRDRLHVAGVTLPPLRDRPEDLPRLLGQLHRAHPGLRPVAPEALAELARCDWPGNVRELRNVLLRANAARTVGYVEAADLGLGAPASRRPLTRLEHLEMSAITVALGDAGGNKAEAAARLGISRSTLYRKLRSYGLGV